MKPIMVIPSKQRSKVGTTWDLFPNAIVSVHKKELHTYKKEGILNKFITHTTDRSSNVRNAILKHFPKGTPIAIMDDDIRKVGCFRQTGRKPKAEKMHPEEFWETLVGFFGKAKRQGYRLFGMAPNSNPLNFKKDRPISSGTFIVGGLTCVWTSNLRFDENIADKNDYDFTLQHLDAGYRTFRLDFLWAESNYNAMDGKGLPGGSSTYRTEDLRAEAYYYLLNKWPKYLIPNPKREMEFIMRVPKKRRAE